MNTKLVWRNKTGIDHPKHWPSMECWQCAMMNLFKWQRTTREPNKSNNSSWKMANSVRSWSCLWPIQREGQMFWVDYPPTAMEILLFRFSIWLSIIKYKIVRNWSATSPTTIYWLMPSNWLHRRLRWIDMGAASSKNWFTFCRPNKFVTFSTIASRELNSNYWWIKMVTFCCILYNSPNDFQAIIFSCQSSIDSHLKSTLASCAI